MKLKVTGKNSGETFEYDWSDPLVHDNIRRTAKILDLPPDVVTRRLLNGEKVESANIALMVVR